ncbi:MAG: hypothetical protein M3R50_12905 [Bacteroidota bacterium]|nr:hypothetical protein [Bacteroidota bacterium]
MNVITSPIKLEESSQNVANLQAALLLLLPALGKLDFTIPTNEIEAKRAMAATNSGIDFLKESFPNTYNPELLVDDLMAAVIKALLSRLFTVKGKLIDNNGKSLADHAIIIAEFDIDQQTEIVTASADTDGAFNCSFIYKLEMQDGDRDTAPDLLFKVRNLGRVGLMIMTPAREASSIFIIENGAEIEVPRLADSEKAPIVLMNIPQEIEIRIVIQITPSNLTEFEQLVMLLSPFMRQIHFADLKEDDNNFQISFLSKKSGIEINIIESLKNAFIQERNSDIPAWVYFGFLELPLPLSEWASKSEEEFIEILTPLQPRNVNVDLKSMSQRLIAIGADKLTK